MQNKTDEAELIAKSLEGDHQAYGELIDRYKDALFRHCFAMLRDEDSAEDIAQDTFITAYYNLGKYNARYRLATWLFKIATNKCLNHLKARTKLVAADDTLLQQIASTRPQPNEVAMDSELRLAVERLRPQYRAVISLYYWQGLDYNETALVMGVPINSVRVWLKRAKLELRKELS